MPAHLGLIVILSAVTGGFGVSLGVPPLAESPTLAKIAPEQCLFYLSSAGVATPDLKSANQTEQLLAEPEVQKLSGELEKLMKANWGKTIGQDVPLPGLPTEELMDLFRLVLTKPLAVYVASVEMGPPRFSLRAGLAVKFDDDIDKVKAKLAELTKALPPAMLGTVKIGDEDFQTIIAPQQGELPGLLSHLVWGFQKKYFLAAWGEGEMEALMKRARGEPPAWLAKIHADLPIARVSTTGYLNVKTARETFGPLAGPQGPALFEAIGLNNVSALESSAGLDETAYLSKTLVCLDGPPQGLLRIATIKPLTADDLAPVPLNAGVALAAKINSLAVFDAAIEVAGKADPGEKEQMLAAIAQMETQFGLKLRDEILKSSGDRFCLYASLGSAGLPDAMATLEVKDLSQAAKTFAKIMQLVEAMLQAQGTNNPKAPKLLKDKIGDRQVYTLQVGTPGVPPLAWCLTDKELIFSMSMPGLQSYLSRPTGFKSLAESPEIKKKLSGGDGGVPMALFYLDVKGIVQAVYPMLPMAAAMLQQQGVKVTLPPMPPADKIVPHLTPLIASMRQTPAGIEIVERTPLPGLAITESGPVAMALLLPAVQAARESARRTQTMANMVQIGLAMQNYHSARKSSPPAYKADKDGKPLLSWRVLILPFLDQNDLYKQFHLDEPWDGEHNKALVARMPDIYKSPSSKVSGEGMTNYLAVRGEKCVFAGANGIALKDITDGTANTIMTVEVTDDKAVVWTKPDDLPYDEKNPLQGLVGLHPDNFLAGFADGSARFISSTIDPAVLKALFTRNGHEPIDPAVLGK